MRDLFRLMISATAVFAVVFFFCVQLAMAHAYLNESIPRADEMLKEAPTRMKLTFTEAIDALMSRVVLYDSIGNEVVIGQTLSDSISTELVFEFPPLRAGVYRVHWVALSMDGHGTEGDFRFSYQVELPSVVPKEAVQIGTEMNWDGAGDRLEEQEALMADQEQNVIADNKQLEGKREHQNDPKVAKRKDPQVIMPKDLNVQVKLENRDRADATQPDAVDTVIQSNERAKMTVQPNENVRYIALNSANPAHEHHSIGNHGTYSSASLMIRILLWIGAFILLYPLIHWGRLESENRPNHLRARTLLNLLGLIAVIGASVWRLIDLQAVYGGELMKIMMSSQVGNTILAIMFVAITIFVFHEYHQRWMTAKDRVIRWIGLIGSIALIAMITWNGHANPYAAQYGWTEWFIQSAHAWLAGGWLLGLLAILIDKNPIERMQVFERYANKGFPALMILGILLAVLRVDWFQLDFDQITLYVSILFFKLGLTIMVLALIFGLRKMKQAIHWRRWIAVEAFCGILLMFISSWLATTGF